MRTFFIGVLLALVGNLYPNLIAQEHTENAEIIILKNRKEEVVANEKEALKSEIQQIMNQLANGEISSATAKELKQAAAELTALNIEAKLAIIDNQIALIQRGAYTDDILRRDDNSIVKIVTGKKTTKHIKRKYKYDRRTTSYLVFALGLNNAIAEDQGLDDSPYSIGGSRFYELGWAWKTRVFNNAGWLRFKYGISFQFNELRPTDNRFLVDQGDQTVLQEGTFNLDRSKFRNDNLVFPIHFEIGPSKKKETENYVRYSTHKKFKIGVGGYGGFNLVSRRKIRFDNEEGNRVRERTRDDFNVNDLIYGVSGYLAWGKIALYAKYDLNTIFENNPIDERNISLGVRFDVD